MPNAAPPPPTLIRNVTLLGTTQGCDVRLANKQIVDVNPAITPRPGERIMDARGCLLLPGLHDHHLHLLAMAAAQQSLRLGPGYIESASELTQALLLIQQQGSDDWIRIIGYDPSLIGELDIATLDQLCPERPIRIQHRGGRLWQLNSCAVDRLCNRESKPLPEGITREQLLADGRLLDQDQWLSRALPNQMPDLTKISLRLARFGITSVTDTTPSNAHKEWHHFAESRRVGKLLQSVRVMGSEALEHCDRADGLTVGELKLHLLESALPDFDLLCERIVGAHQRGRNVAIHCVTRVELVYALSALDQSGALQGDRIEHASVCPPELLEDIKRLGLRVVTQPAFLYERGDRYLRDVATEDQAWLYRGRGFREHGVALAIGSDAPFATENPWRQMHTAVTRRTLGDQIINAAERLKPEEAMALYLSPAATPGLNLRSVEVGAPADLCLIDRGWAVARADLSQVNVSATWIDGHQVYGLSDD